MCSIDVKNTLFRTFCTPMYTCHLWWNYKAQSFHKLKVAFNNAFRMLHDLPTYCSASEMFTVNGVADCKAVIRNLVHRFMTILRESPLLRYQPITTAVVTDACLNTRWHHGAYTPAASRESLGMDRVVTMYVVQSAQWTLNCRDPICSRQFSWVVNRHSREYVRRA